MPDTWILLFTSVGVGEGGKTLGDTNIGFGKIKAKKIIDATSKMAKQIRPIAIIFYSFYAQYK